MRITGIMPKIAAGRNFSMAFSGSKFFLNIKPDIKPEDFEKEQALLDNEASQAQKARQKGISVPQYRTKLTDNGEHIKQIRYETEGDTPDIKTNPFTMAYFGSLLKNLYYMDAAGIFHNDLDPSHIFLKKDGQVELDCFRFSVNFYKKPNGPTTGDKGCVRTPDFVYPSNEKLFEEQFLGGYVSKMDDDDKAHFIRNYLFYRSDYHRQRAGMLFRRNFPHDSKTIRYETLQAELFINPPARVIAYEINKLDVLKLKREAFTEWDEGGGACGHEVSPQRIFNSVLLHLDCIEAALRLKELAKENSSFAKTAEEREYFAFEEEIASLQLKNLIDDTKGMGGWTFNDTKNGIFLADQKKKRFFEELFDEIKPADGMAARAAILDVKEYYSGLKDVWDEDLNALLMEEY